jgi:hypothetical protein
MSKRKILSTLLLTVVLSFIICANTVAFAVDGNIISDTQYNETEQILIEPTAVVPIVPLSASWSVNFTGAFSPGAVPGRGARLSTLEELIWKQLTFHGRTFHNISQQTVTIDAPLPGGPVENARPVHAFCYADSNRHNSRSANLSIWGINPMWM